MRLITRILTLSALILALAACENNEQSGSLIGGVAGGLLGAQVGSGSGRTVAIITGAVLGSYFGNQVGQRMDEVDRMRMSQATNRALQENRAYEWSTDNAHGSVRPASRTYHYQERQCREFHSEVQFTGESKWSNAYGCACRDSQYDHWKMVQNSYCRQS